ncbi:MAG: hypothetical protein K8S54_03925, partial [Spirochaetia bacterium]|nr:hypothetical protein [Spirochaetia bacterium]
KESIIVQMYLFAASGELRTLLPVDCLPWAGEVANWLIEAKRQKPELKIIVILDSQTIAEASRTHYRKFPLTRHRLEDAQIIVLNASLARTAHARGMIALSHNKEGSQEMEKNRWATLQQRWQTAHNVEDHRKNIVIDSGRAGIVFSHNLIDQARLWQENTFLLRNGPARHLYSIALGSLEDALALPLAFTQEERATLSFFRPMKEPEESQDGTEVLDGGPAIHSAILAELESARSGEIRVASAYFSDLTTLERLIDVGSRVRVRILIDNCHALSLPRLLHFILRNTVNLACVHRCRSAPRVELRVFPSRHLEMMHLKAIALSAKPCLIAGQANFTPNSFSGAWLETNVLVRNPFVVRQFERHFEEIWNMSVPVRCYKDMGMAEFFKHRTHAFVFLILIRVADWLGFRY